MKRKLIFSIIMEMNKMKNSFWIRADCAIFGHSWARKIKQPYEYHITRKCSKCDKKQELIRDKWYDID